MYLLSSHRGTLAGGTLKRLSPSGPEEEETISGDRMYNMGRAGKQHLESQRSNSPKNHHVERVVGDAGDERHEGDEEDGGEQEMCTGHRA